MTQITAVLIHTQTLKATKVFPEENGMLARATVSSSHSSVQMSVKARRKAPRRTQRKILRSGIGAVLTSMESFASADFVVRLW